MADLLPRVSEVLKELFPDSYANVPMELMERARERGDALHKLSCQRLAAMQGLCPEPDRIPAEYQKPYDGLLDWIISNQVRPILVEDESENRTVGYRGTPDALVHFGPKQIVTLIDFKFTAAILLQNKVQVQAYWKLSGYEKARKAILVRIDPYSGEAKPHEVKPNPVDWWGFVSTVNVIKYRQQVR